jgi:glycogen debranching enzyme
MQRRIARTWLLLLPWLLVGAATSGYAQDRAVRVYLPALHTDHGTLNQAFRIALGDLLGNVQLYQHGLLDQPQHVMLAGLDYGTPWTRDASMNCWNGASLLLPDVAQQTLLSVLQEDPQGVQIGGQYWDAIVWATGAWHHYLYTGDRQFLQLAVKATGNTLRHREATEFDAETGLFRGPGWSDGVAAYPLRYTNPNGHSGILEWPKSHPDKAVSPGYGIPMEALSTNCLYYNAYVTAIKMATELGDSPDPSWANKAASLKDAINRHLWKDQLGHYRFFTDPWGGCDHQEGLGHAYALLFGVADAAKSNAIVKRIHVTPAGLPCEWPSFPRYDAEDGQAFARHAGPVWPQIQAIWAEAMARRRERDAFAHELFQLAEHAVRDEQFVEIYHPLTGERYGGMQEQGPGKIVLWEATSRQTWAATGFLRMILLGLAGLRFDTEGVAFEPCIPSQVTHVELRNLRYRQMTMDLILHGNGLQVRECRVNGELVATPFLAADQTGHQTVQLLIGP